MGWVFRVERWDEVAAAGAGAWELISVQTDAANAQAWARQFTNFGHTARVVAVYVIRVGTLGGG